MEEWELEHMTRILAGVAAAALLAGPALAQNTMATPSHTDMTTSTTDHMTSDTDSSGKTVTKHHKVVKHHKKASAKKSDDNSMGNSAQ